MTFGKKPMFNREPKTDVRFLILRMIKRAVKKKSISS
jgi:hypothetical protein